MIAEKLKEVKENIEGAKAKRSLDKQHEVRLIAVTKNHDVQAMREAIDAGVTDIGENRIQEAKEKFATLDRDVTWHLIGHLQTNKAKQAVKIFDLIHSVDTLHLAEAINNAAAGINKVQKVLVQVNLAKEDSKSGVYVEELEDLLHKVDELPNLQLMGLIFSTANILYLSMGMTHDYEIAVEEGANMVRVGTGIFGPRQY